MAFTVVWHGTQLESAELVTAISHNCTCTFGLMGVREFTCPPHAMMVSDQRAMDGLLFVHGMRARLLREEFAPS